MKKILPEMNYITSFEDASILRKFFILFFVAAIIPLLVIANIFVLNIGEEKIFISSYDLGFTLLFSTLGVLAAFIGMRTTLKKIIMIHPKSQPVNAGEPKGRTKVKEQNEIETLAKSFDAIQKQLEDGLRDLEKLKNSR
jgi:HAMP domain-containing protein